MLELIVRRLAIGIITLFTTSVVFFVGGELVPGDFASEMARLRASIGERVDFDNMEMMRETLGLYRPVHVRYFEWLNDVSHGDFGTSWANDIAVSTLIAKRLPNTLFLAAVTTLIAVPLSVGLGVFAAARQGSKADRLVTMFSLSALSVPEFMMAYLLVFALAVTFPLFPAVAIHVDSLSLGARLYTITLPVLTLTLTMMASMARLTRATVINVLGREFIEMAHLKGLSNYRILMHHAMPHAIAPIINIVILAIANLVVGTFIVEFVFAYPGIGQLMLESVRLQHMPVVQACGLIFATTYILLVLLADVISILSNPRVAERELPAVRRLQSGQDGLAKLIRLLRNEGRHNGRQILNREALKRALQADQQTGLPTGWSNESGEDRYHMSLWLVPYRAHFGCRVWVPSMSGYGGNYVVMMPNGITAFRFADGRDSNPGTWDSSWLRYVTDYMRPHCL